MAAPITASKDKKGLIRDYVYETLKKNIMELRLEPGRQISEKDLVEMLDVSRTPIREALVRLTQEELIETTPQKGSVISLIDLEHAEESRFLRETLESAIVREACDKLSGENVLHLQHLVSLQELSASEENYERLFELDEEFHRTIILGCGRVRTWGLIQQVTTHYNRIRYLRLAANHDWRVILSQHQDIVQAIKEKDPDAAERVLREHLKRVVVEKEELVRMHPSYFKV